MRSLIKQYLTPPLNLNSYNFLISSTSRWFKLAFILLILTFFTACGGGGGSESSGSSGDEDTNENNNSSSVPVLSVVSTNQINVSWSSVANATYYRLYRAASKSGSYAEIMADNTTSFQDTGLIVNTSYYYKLKACLNTTESSCADFSSLVQVTTLKLRGSIKLNDTGITWGGNYPSGNNNGSPPSCDSVDTDNSDTPLAKQDCHYGRDVQAAAGTLDKTGGGEAGFDFTKLGADGTALTNQNATWADNGTEASGTKWSCVRDNHTGYVWEVKNNNGTAPVDSSNPSVDNIHHKDNQYKWGGLTAIGREHSSRKGDYDDDWNGLVNGANQNSYAGNTGLCGYTDWRVSKLKELMTITHKSRINPTIDIDYFPNTNSNYYWSSSPYAYDSGYAWVIYFNYGGGSSYSRSANYYVRLVRAGQ